MMKQIAPYRHRDGGRPGRVALSKRGLQWGIELGLALYIGFAAFHLHLLLEAAGR